MGSEPQADHDLARLGQFTSVADKQDVSVARCLAVPGEQSQHIHEHMVRFCHRLDLPVSAAPDEANPAIGPATPMSSSMARVRMGERIRMNAPSVPNKVGDGRKNGKLASTRQYLHAT